MLALAVPTAVPVPAPLCPAHSLPQPSLTSPQLPGQKAPRSYQQPTLSPAPQPCYQGSRKTKQTGQGSHPRLQGDPPLIFNHPLPHRCHCWALGNPGQASGPWPVRMLHILGQRPWPWPEAAMERGDRGSRSSSPLISNHRVTDPEAKAGGRTFARALRLARAGEVGLAVSWNDPAPLRARPFWSRLEKPPDWVGALPAAWEKCLFRAEGCHLLASLSSHSGCGRHSPARQAGGRGPGAPEKNCPLLQDFCPEQEKILARESSNPDPARWGTGRARKASWRRWLLRTA